MTPEQIKTLEENLAIAIEALKMYEDPWSFKDIIENETSIPDFYSETDFGMFARDALVKISANNVVTKYHNTLKNLKD
jgi:hypothetical protein